MDVCVLNTFDIAVAGLSTLYVGYPFLFLLGYTIDLFQDIQYK